MIVRGDDMDIPKIVRYLLIAGLLLLLLVAWRLFSPLSIPMVVNSVSEDAVELWGRPYFTIGEVAVTPTLLIKAFVFIAVLLLVARVGSRTVRTALLDRTGMETGQKFALERVLNYFVVTLGLIIGLQSTGLDLSSLTVFSGALGIGIGLGLQTIAKDFASGLILLFERPVKVGDRIVIEDLRGDVINIGLRGTWVRTNDNVVMIVPNSEFVEGRVTNWTANDRSVRINIPFGVSYGSDPDHVRKVVVEVARRHADVLDNPSPDVIFLGFGDSSLDFEVRVWTMKQLQTPKIIASDVYFEMFQAFREENIEIPFPQRDLHVRSVDLPIPVSQAQGSVAN